ncbi:MAG: TIGR04013 family B12-binding domain/radical SAM domain-containing protein [bacterium]|nr:TIGR04013 family B12-binding domain/radical SAM domain-containing protein [bacterium]
MKKKRAIFRLSPANRLSFPILLNIWEKHKIDADFEIIIRESPLTAPPLQTVTDNDVVLYSFMTPHLPQIHEEIKVVKKSGALIVGGGPHVLGEQDLCFEMGFNVLFVGPAEESFKSFGHHLLNNSIEKHKIYKSTSAPGDFNDYLPISKYIRGLPPLEIMRGCFWNCNYCTTGLSKVIYRDFDSIKIYLNEIKNKNYNRINYICPSSMEYGASKGRLLDLDKLEELLRFTASYGFKFFEFGIFPSEIRPDSVSPDVMSLLRKYATQKSITLGAQSGCNNRLKEIKRGHSTHHIENAAAVANDHGFLAYLDFIVAYPGESHDERRTTVDFIKYLNKKYRIRTQIHHFFPLSGSHYAFHLPAYLAPDEKELLVNLTKSGIARDGWVQNETQTKAYFSWLKEYFPRHYSKYS